MVVLVVSLFSAGALLLLLLAASLRAAAAGRAERVQGPPLVGGRGARFGDAAATPTTPVAPAPVAPATRPSPFREPRAA